MKPTPAQREALERAVNSGHGTIWNMPMKSYHIMSDAGWIEVRNSVAPDEQERLMAQRDKAIALAKQAISADWRRAQTLLDHALSLDSDIIVNRYYITDAGRALVSKKVTA